MRKGIMQSGLVALSLFSTLAMADVKVSRGSLTQELSLNATKILLSDDFSDVTFQVQPGADRITVTLGLAAESDKKLDKYLDSWVLAAKDRGAILELDLVPRRGSASQSCSRVIVNGRYTKLKGVCAEGLVVTIPEGLNPNLSSDEKIIFLNDAASESEVPGEAIPSEIIAKLHSDLRRASFGSDKVTVIASFVIKQFPTGRTLLASDLGGILKAISFDDDKLQALSILRPLISNREEAYNVVVEILSFSSSKEEARVLLFEI